jgi:uncharacterized protein
MERFLPGRHLIDSFGNGGFRLGGVSHQGSILIAPSGVRALDVVEVAMLLRQHFDLLVTERNELDMLLIGTGRNMLPLPKSLVQHLSEQGLQYDVMSTNAAVRTYNVVLEEDRRVAAILIAVDNAHG